MRTRRVLRTAAAVWRACASRSSCGLGEDRTKIVVASARGLDSDTLVCTLRLLGRCNTDPVVADAPKGHLVSSPPAARREASSARIACSVVAGTDREYSETGCFEGTVEGACPEAVNKVPLMCACSQNAQSHPLVRSSQKEGGFGVACPGTPFAGGTVVLVAETRGGNRDCGVPRSRRRRIPMAAVHSSRSNNN